MRSWLLCTLLLFALSACSQSFMAPAPPSGAPRTVSLGGPVPLHLELPPGYEMQAEQGPSFDVFHVWRVPPLPLQLDTSLAVFVGPIKTPYCPPDVGRYAPADFRAWKLRWHICGEQGATSTVWETFVPSANGQDSVHIVVIGNDMGELHRLRAIAETLRPLRG